jgi:hypothetical protein
MKRTKPAMAKMARASPPISVLDGQAEEASLTRGAKVGVVALSPALFWTDRRQRMPSDTETCTS